MSSSPSSASSSPPQIPEKMKCVLIKDGKGPAENMYIGEEAVPKPKEGEALVKVRPGATRVDSYSHSNPGMLMRLKPCRRRSEHSG
jgi:hypothetical protein